MSRRFILVAAGWLTALLGWTACRSSPDPRKLFAEAEELRLVYTKDASHKAISKYRDARSEWTRQGNTRDAARASQGIGATYEQLGRLKESLTSCLEALSLSQQSRDRLQESHLRSDVGVAHARLGQADQALPQCRAALELGARWGGAPERARGLNCLGEVEYHRGDSQKALALYREAETLWGRLGDERRRAEALLSTGSAQSDLNDLDSAARSLNDALSLWASVGDKRGQALTQLALARLQYLPGEYQNALNRYTSLRDRFQAAGDGVWEAACLSSMAYVYEQMGDGPMALRYWEEASGLFETAGLQMAALEMFIKIGTSHLAADVATALKWLERARALSQACGNRHMQSWALRYMGVAHLTLGDATKSLRYLEQSLEIQQSVEDPRFRGRTLADLGRAYELLGDHDRAVAQLERALELSRFSRDRVGEAMAFFGLARTSVGLNHLDAAREQIERALEIAESLRTEVENRDLRASYFASVYQYHELHMDVLMRLDRVRPREGLATAAFEASERARARSLLDSLTGAGVDLRAGLDADLLTREQTLKSAFDDWAKRRRRLSGERAHQADLRALADEYRDLEERHNHLQAELRSRSPRYAALAQPQPLSLEDVQQQVLDGDTLLLEYALGDERSYLWAVSARSQASFQLAPRADIERAARRVYERLTARLDASADQRDRRRRIERADAEYWQEAERLSEMLLGPVARRMAGKRILVVSDGALQYLPFAALPVPGRRDDPVPLIAEHEIVSLPSASVLAVLRRETRHRLSPDKAVAVLADPVFEADDPRLHAGPVAAAGHGLLRDDSLSVSRLISTRQEADAIVAAVPAGMAWKAIDFDASRATAMSPELAKYRIVHFATHGVFDNDHPGLSGVILSMFDRRGQPQDGFLRLHDIYGLDVPAELVVLSACNTALGRPVRGEGLVGIVRGFMHAGAKRVVASLWKVDDEATGEMMSRFYRGMLREHRSPAAALREAQLAMWERARWRAPYYWAAFVLQGEWK